MNTLTDRATIVLTVVVLMISLLRRSRWYKKWSQNFINDGITFGSIENDIKVVSPGFKLTRDKIIPHFMNHDNTISFQELKQSLLQLKGYRKLSVANNNVKMLRCQELTESERIQLIDIGYFKKIQSVESCINQNSTIVSKIIETTLNKLYQDNKKNSDYAKLITQLSHELGYDVNNKNGEITMLKNGNVSNGDTPIMRINESLSHICRDWSTTFRTELNPIIEYIESQLKTIPNINSKKNILVIPGCGVGYIPYYFAHKYPNLQVHSIEWSNFMYICNQFALNHGKDIEISPFNQYYSNQLSLAHQTRLIKVPLKQIKENNGKNKNLISLWGDFRNYIPNVTESQINNITVLSVYFLDTAENVFQYLDSIESLRKYCSQDLHWINVGPLKYGTRPLVQFNVEELSKLKQLRGWKDLDTQTDNKLPNLNGYLTDNESLYQGYYGLNKFHSRYTKAK